MRTPLRRLLLSAAFLLLVPVVAQTSSAVATPGPAGPGNDVHWYLGGRAPYSSSGKLPLHLVPVNEGARELWAVGAFTSDPAQCGGKRSAIPDPACGPDYIQGIVSKSIDGGLNWTAHIDAPQLARVDSTAMLIQRYTNGATIDDFTKLNTSQQPPTCTAVCVVGGSPLNDTNSNATGGDGASNGTAAAWAEAQVWCSGDGIAWSRGADLPAPRNAAAYVPIPSYDIFILLGGYHPRPRGLQDDEATWGMWVAGFADGYSCVPSSWSIREQFVPVAGRAYPLAVWLEGPNVLAIGGGGPLRFGVISPSITPSPFPTPAPPDVTPSPPPDPLLQAAEWHHHLLQLTPPTQLPRLELGLAGVWTDVKLSHPLVRDLRRPGSYSLLPANGVLLTSRAASLNRSGHSSDGGGASRRQLMDGGNRSGLGEEGDVVGGGGGNMEIAQQGDGSVAEEDMLAFFTGQAMFVTPPRPFNSPETWATGRRRRRLSDKMSESDEESCSSSGGGRRSLRSSRALQASAYLDAVPAQAHVVYLPPWMRQQSSNSSVYDGSDNSTSQWVWQPLRLRFSPGDALARLVQGDPLFPHVLTIEVETGLIWRGTAQACIQTNCGPNQYAGQCVHSPFDAGCISCSPCPSAHWESAPCGPLADRACSPCTSTCPKGTRLAHACTATSDIVCGPDTDGGNAPPPSRPSAGTTALPAAAAYAFLGILAACVVGACAAPLISGRDGGRAIAKPATVTTGGGNSMSSASSGGGTGESSPLRLRTHIAAAAASICGHAILAAYWAAATGRGSGSNLAAQCGGALVTVMAVGWTSHAVLLVRASAGEQQQQRLQVQRRASTAHVKQRVTAQEEQAPGGLQLLSPLAQAVWQAPGSESPTAFSFASGVCALVLCAWHPGVIIAKRSNCSRDVDAAGVVSQQLFAVASTLAATTGLAFECLLFAIVFIALCAAPPPVADAGSTLAVALTCLLIEAAFVAHGTYTALQKRALSVSNSSSSSSHSKSDTATSAQALQEVVAYGERIPRRQRQPQQQRSAVNNNASSNKAVQGTIAPVAASTSSIAVQPAEEGARSIAAVLTANPLVLMSAAAATAPAPAISATPEAVPPPAASVTITVAMPSVRAQNHRAAMMTSQQQRPPSPPTPSSVSSSLSSERSGSRSSGGSRSSSNSVGGSGSVGGVTLSLLQSIRAATAAATSSDNAPSPSSSLSQPQPDMSDLDLAGAMTTLAATAASEEGRRLALAVGFFRDNPDMIPPALQAVQQPSLPEAWRRILAVLEEAAQHDSPSSADTSSGGGGAEEGDNDDSASETGGGQEGHSTTSGSEPGSYQDQAPLPLTERAREGGASATGKQ